MDPVTQVAGIGMSSWQQFGFPAALVILLIFGCWRLLERQDKRLEVKDAEHRAERKEERGMHLDAMTALTGAVNKVGEGMKAAGDAIEAMAKEVTDIKREVERPQVRRGG